MMPFDGIQETKVKQSLKCEFHNLMTMSINVKTLKLHKFIIPCTLSFRVPFRYRYLPVVLHQEQKGPHHLPTLPQETVHNGLQLAVPNQSFERFYITQMHPFPPNQEKITLFGLIFQYALMEIKQSH